MNRQDFLGRNKNTSVAKPAHTNNKTETAEEQGITDFETGQEKQAINAFRVAWKKDTGKEISRAKAKELITKKQLGNIFL